MIKEQEDDPSQERKVTQDLSERTPDFIKKVTLLHPLDDRDGGMTSYTRSKLT